MIIPQPDRILLAREIETHARRLSGDILDIGCGKLRRYARFCTSVKTYRTLDVDASFEPDIVGSAEAIPLPDASVDAVICTQVLEHVEHPWIAMKEIARILRPGGKCLITVPQTNELHEEPHDYYRFTKYALESLCRDNGLRIDAMEQRGSFFATQAQMHIRGLINRWSPYQNRIAMYALWPVCAFLAFAGMKRDEFSRHPTFLRHAIGWCFVATKT